MLRGEKLTKKVNKLHNVIEYTALDKRKLTLPLFMPGVLANHPNDTFPTDDFAITTNLFHGSTHFHHFNPLARGSALSRASPS